MFSPVRNEESHLPALARSITSQTHLPRVWFILDDGSSDRTPEIIQGLCSKHPWIISQRLETEQGGLGLHFGEIMKKGFEETILYANQENIEYQLIGKADADVIIPPDCIQELIQEFEIEPRLGIASPALIIQDRHYNNERRIRKDITFGDHPTDGLRLIRMECYNEIGGYLITRSPETVAEAKAKIRGWQIRRCKHIQAYLERISHESTTIWARWTMNGSMAYYLGYPPIIVIGRLAYEIIFERPWYRPWAYVWGYLRSALRHEPRIPDQEVLNYFKKQRLREILPQIPELIRYAAKKAPQP